MPENRIQAVGVVRFSVLTNDYYAETYKTVDLIREHIFERNRLEFRLRLLENLCLQTLKAQTDQDFHCVILTSSELPDWARERLDALIAPIPNVTCHAQPVDFHYRSIRKAYETVELGDATHRLSFRIDDDDAVALDYIERLKRIGAGLVAMQERDEPTIIAFNRGFYVEMSGEGPHRILDSVERSPLSVGAALLHPTHVRANPYRYNHRKFPQHYSTYTDISAPGFLRTIHGGNKSNPAKLGLVGKLAPEEVERQLRHYFGLEHEILRTL